MERDLGKSSAQINAVMTILCQISQYIDLSHTFRSCKRTKQLDKHQELPRIHRLLICGDFGGEEWVASVITVLPDGGVVVFRGFIVKCFWLPSRPACAQWGIAFHSSGRHHRAMMNDHHKRQTTKLTDSQWPFNSSSSDQIVTPQLHAQELSCNVPETGSVLNMGGCHTMAIACLVKLIRSGSKDFSLLNIGLIIHLDRTLSGG